MKIEIKKIVKDLPLREYAAEYGDVALTVWVNPPKKLTDERLGHLKQSSGLLAELDAFAKLNRDGGAQQVDGAVARMDEIGREIAALTIEMRKWMAEIWSQGPEETRMTMDELGDFVEQCDEHDPQLYAWLVSRTLEMIQDYRTGKKKF